MPHFWTPDPSGPWAVLPLAQDAYQFDGAWTLRSQLAPAAACAPAAVLKRFGAGTGESWVMWTERPQAVLVNGLPLLLGVRVLRDKDEIRLNGSHRFFFSTERLANIVPFPGAEHAVYCARCKQAVAPGNPAVQCPQCRTWCHQFGELNCWTYGPTCPQCDQTTALDAGYRWTPEGL